MKFPGVTVCPGLVQTSGFSFSENVQNGLQWLVGMRFYQLVRDQSGMLMCRAGSLRQELV
jgi:hypothetical protein